MRIKSIVTLLIFTLLLAACGYPISTLPVDVPETQTIPTTYPQPVISTIAPAPYPEPVVGTPFPTYSAYPEPGTPGAGTPVIPPSGYEPQPGDENLSRDQVYVDLFNSQILTSATETSQVKAVLQGNLPDPCHSLRVIVTPPDTNNTINLDVYSLVDPGKACITMIKPFTASIPLGSYSSGQYSVMVNGEKLGVFGTGYEPQPGDENLKRDQVFVDIANSRFSTPDAPTSQVQVVLQGNLPDPCHSLRVVVPPPDSNNVINLDVYSVVDPGEACITVLEPFTASIPLGFYPNGQFTLMVNGERLGDFSAGSGVAPAVPVTP
jgi:hypothetical protein